MYNDEEGGLEKQQLESTETASQSGHFWSSPDLQVFGCKA